jgi:hypothetical protein
MAKRLVRQHRPRERPDRFHTFLKRLRAGGRTNMYGAIPYLMHAFELDRETAFRVVCDWVDRQAEAAAEPAAEPSAEAVPVPPRRPRQRTLRARSRR